MRDGICFFSQAASLYARAGRFAGRLKDGCKSRDSASYSSGMEMHDVSRFSIFRDLPAANSRKRKETMQVYSFLLAVQNYLKIEDVKFGGDPPDFVITSAGSSIGLELTTLNPSIFPTGGYKRRAKFGEWKKKLEVNSKPEREFSWGEFSMRESLESVRYQINRKSTSITKAPKLHNEQWLLLHVDNGSPPGSVLKLNRIIDGNYKESIWDYTGKYLYEIQKCSKAAILFSYVILWCGADLLAFPTGDNHYNLPTPKSSLLAHGAQASDEILEWKSRLSSVRMRYDSFHGHAED